MSLDEIVFVKYGSSLEPLNEDELPRKKPCLLEEQIVKDKQGRRRFHGAFTGGFSAGYFNTVGSTTGWKPSSFRSSRSKKEEFTIQKPENFMDEEDTGEFGIAPMILKTRENYLNERKNLLGCNVQFERNLGEFVVKNFLRPIKETIGAKLLKKMGWKPGQGIGPKMNMKEKKTNLKFKQKIYGCNLPPELFENKDDSDSNAEWENIKFAPTDSTSISFTLKYNFFGIGYEDLQRKNFLGSFSDTHRENKLFRNKLTEKYSNMGHGFGVGVFEDEDEDIYSKDDTDQYDFFLSHELQSQEVKTQNIVKGILDGFSIQINKNKNKHYQLPNLPENLSLYYKTKIENFCETKKKSYELNNKYDFNKWDKHIKTLNKINKQSQKLEESQNLKPFTNTIFKKFLVASQPDDLSNPLATVDKFASENEDCIRAAKLKMFGALTRKIEEWEPSPLLSKRFNIPELKKINQDITKEKKNIIFDNISSTSLLKEKVQDVKENINDFSVCSPVALEKKINANTLKIDLFKEIFLVNDDISEISINLKEEKIEEVFEEKIINSKKNTSPPRGIFEHISLKKKSEEKTNEVFNSASCSDDNNDTSTFKDIFYGPKIPNNIIEKYDFQKTNKVFKDSVSTKKTVKTQHKKKNKKQKKSSHKGKHKRKSKK